MKKTLTLIKNLPSSNSGINELLESYENGKIDEDTLISSVILTLIAKKPTMMKMMTTLSLT